MSTKRVSEMTDAEVQALASPQTSRRITLNLSDEQYRDLVRWAASAAVAIDVPLVGVQDALRAMLRGTLDSTPATNAALRALRNERQRSTAS